MSISLYRPFQILVRWFARFWPSQDRHFSNMAASSLVNNCKWTLIIGTYNHEQREVIVISFSLKISQLVGFLNFYSAQDQIVNSMAASPLVKSLPIKNLVQYLLCSYNLLFYAWTYIFNIISENPSYSQLLHVLRVWQWNLPVFNINVFLMQYLYNRCFRSLVVCSYKLHHWCDLQSI